MLALYLQNKTITQPKHLLLTLPMTQGIGQEIHLRFLDFKNCLFGATNMVQNSDKSKYLYSGYRTEFDGAGSWKFGNKFARNVVILLLIIVYHLMSIISKIIFQCQVKDRLMILMVAFALQRKSLVLIFVMPGKSFACVWIKMVIIVICWLTKKKCMFKGNNKDVNSKFQLSFVQEAYLLNFIVIKLKKCLLKKMCMIFQSVIMLFINLTY